MMFGLAIGHVFLDHNDADVFGLLLQELMRSVELDHRPEFNSVLTYCDLIYGIPLGFGVMFSHPSDICFIL